ncbi:MAG: MFS transporter [Legionellales bacterium]
MDVRPNKRLLAHVWIVCALSLFIDGYDLYISSVAEPFINAFFHPSPFLIGLTQAAAPIGAALGALLMGRVADKVGRKSLLIVNLFFFIVIALLSACAWDMTSLCVFRFLIGFGVGADYPICAAYLAEVIPKNKSRQFIAAAMFVNCLASPVGAAVAWLLFQYHPTLDLWRWLFASGAIPAVVALLLRTKLPESFIWQAQQKLQPRMPFLQHYKKLVSPSLRRKTICMCLSWFFLDISYYGIGLFTPAVLRAVHILENADLLTAANDMLMSTLFVNLFVVLGAFSTIFVIAKVNPFQLQKMGFLLSFLGLLTLSFSNTVPDAFTSSMIFSGFILFNLFVNFGPGITTYLLPAELYPSDIKATGHGVAASCGKMGAAIGTLLLPLLQFYIGIYYTVGILAMTLLLGWALTYLLSLETEQQQPIWNKDRSNHALPTQ